jgi:ribonuclease HI
MAHYEAYTDGACKGNPGPGGWGVCLLKDGEVVFENFGGVQNTTNNRMELQAALIAMEQVKERCLPGDTFRLMVDSEYVNKGNNEWLEGWVKKDFKKVKNDDLWRDFYELKKTLASLNITVESQWVRGHDGNRYNERADKLANRGVLEPNGPLNNGPMTDAIKTTESAIKQVEPVLVDVMTLIEQFTQACKHSRGDVNKLAELTGLDAQALLKLSEPEPDRSPSPF